jgi:type II secretory pathway pseudopilin PulG
MNVSRPRHPNHPSAGFSLTEALVGFTIASGLMMAIAPIVLIAVSSRLYNSQVDRATQLAQGELDRVQTLMAQGVSTNQENQLPPAVGAGVSVSQAGAPTASVTSLTSLDSPTKALEVDTDNDGQIDFLVQLFRDPGLRFTEGVSRDQLAVFRMGVRVYSGLARDNLGQLSTALAPVNLIRGIGEQRVRPLATLYSEMSTSDSRVSLQRYRDYLNSLP